LHGPGTGSAGDDPLAGTVVARRRAVIEVTATGVAVQTALLAFEAAATMPAAPGIFVAIEWI